MEVTVIDVLKQMAIAIPSIMVGTQAITAVLKRKVKVKARMFKSPPFFLPSPLSVLLP